jgi:DNA adenine methylase
VDDRALHSSVSSAARDVRRAVRRRRLDPAAQGARSKAEIYNDLDETLIRIFKVLQDPAKAARLVQLLEVTPYSRKEFDWAYNCTGLREAGERRQHERCKLDDVEEVRRTLVRSWMGYGSDGTAGAYRTGFRSIVNHAGKTPGRRMGQLRRDDPRTIDRIRGVNIECRDAFECAEQYDGPETLFYFDPPYLPETRSYRKPPARRRLSRLPARAQHRRP